MSTLPLAVLARGSILATARSSCSRAALVSCQSFRTRKSNSSRTFFISNASRLPVSELSKDPLSSSGIHKVGTEGLHKHDLPTSSSAAPKAVISNPDNELQNTALLSMKAAPFAPMSEEAQHHQGDWVLFHPVYTSEELKAVKVLQHERKTFGDKVAGWFVFALRRGFDIVSRYKHRPMPANHSTMSVEELRKGSHIMDPSQWLMRILFLETIA